MTKNIINTEPRRFNHISAFIITTTEIIAFGDVATGNINANEAAITVDTIKP